MTDTKRPIFMCDCGTEGIVVLSENDMFEGTEDGPAVDLAFMGTGHQKDGRMSWRERIRVIWRIIRKGNVFNDMVIMSRATARNLAHHLLYITSKDKVKEQELLVREGPDIQPNEPI